jgi:hypothetical protein
VRTRGCRTSTGTSASGADRNDGIVDLTATSYERPPTFTALPLGPTSASYGSGALCEITRRTSKARLRIRRAESVSDSGSVTGADSHPHVRSDGVSVAAHNALSSEYFSLQGSYPNICAVRDEEAAGSDPVTLTGTRHLDEHAFG